MSDLLTRAKEIKNATEIGENTAERVGGVMVDTVNAITSLQERAVLHEDTLTTHGKQITALQNKGQNIEYDIERQQGVLDFQSIRLTEVEHRADEHDTQIAKVQDEKAPKVGYAPELKVNFANELVGRGEATPQVIGQIRPTGEISIGDGNATIEKVKGKSVVWNQVLNASGVFAQYDRDLYTITLSNGLIEVSKSEGTSTVDSLFVYFIHNFIASKKYLIVYNLIRFDGQNTSAIIASSGIYDGVKYHNLIEVYGADYKFFSPTESFTSQQMQILQNVTAGVALSYTLRPVIYDLTQMFGAGNEPTTIEEFEARKPFGVSDDYNEGEIISYDGANELKSVGFNAWDEEWESGAISTVTGADISSVTQIRSSRIRLIPNEEYYCNYAKSVGAIWMLFWDNKGKLVEPPYGMSNVGYAINIKNVKFTIPSDCSYARFYTTQEYGAVYTNDICIHLVHSGYRNGEYKPYEADILQLPGPKSIKDKDGNQLFPYGLLSAGSVHDEITATKAIKRIGVVDMGTLRWSDYTEYSYGYSSGQVEGIKQSNLNFATPLYYEKIVLPSSDYAVINDKFITTNGIVIGPSFANKVLIKDTSIADLATFKQAMQGVMLYYELAEPIEVDLEEPLNLTYEAWDFGTEELKTDAKTTPLNADISYQFNAVDRIRENTTKASDLEARIAQLEAMLTQMAQANESNEA